MSRSKNGAADGPNFKIAIYIIVLVLGLNLLLQLFTGWEIVITNLSLQVFMKSIKIIIFFIYSQSLFQEKGLILDKSASEYAIELDLLAHFPQLSSLEVVNSIFIC